MVEHTDESLRGSRFERVDLSESRLHGVVLANVKITDAWVYNLDISCELGSLVVNGIDVREYVNAERERRYPELRMLRATDADGLRDAWRMLETRADATLARARALPEEKLHESVDGEWSYLETLRHLVYATDRWITGPVLEQPEPLHRLGMPNNDPEPWRGTLDIDVDPPLDEVLEVRNDRRALVAALLADLTDADVARAVTSPNGGTTTVGDCIRVVMGEEWEHDRYANRDLDALGAPASG